MPLISRSAIRAAMLYLILGLAGWMVYYADLTWDIPANWSALRVVSVHLIAVGWLTQLIFAVMYWMFPIMSRATPYGNTRVAWIGFVCLNSGLLFRAFFEVGRTQGFPAEAGWGMVGAAILQWFGATAWVIATWGRVRERAGK